MGVDIKHEGRLAAIELLTVRRYSKKCACCGQKHKDVDMWHCYRYGLKESMVDYWYCLNCMKSAEDVLHEIDTDAVPFGLAGIDGYDASFKKDLTRISGGAKIKGSKKRKAAKK